jgi:N6-L-threonylcarbamoyladenine synthase
VARNTALRKNFQSFAQKHHLPSFIPLPEFCTDNAVMVAALAQEKINLGETAELQMDLNAYPRVRS